MSDLALMLSCSPKKIPLKGVDFLPESIQSKVTIFPFRVDNLYNVTFLH